MRSGRDDIVRLALVGSDRVGYNIQEIFFAFVFLKLEVCHAIA